ncbi:benzoylformate decarboxylase [Nocardioides sp. MAHUQ-72]|uniref:benzoylformate decarboxylase n=1 Tax=unclassified Nocardioides TaxID=2615069 RepID=UPI003611580D
MPSTVRDITHRLLQRAGVEVLFGNPGSNELPFLAGLPEDITYVLGLHEGVVVGMADGYAQASARLGVVNLHAASGTGNAMGALTNAAVSRTPLLVIAGQQVRDTVGQEVMLASADAGALTRPLTGFSAEPLSAGDVPRTVAQAMHEAGPARGGPSYVSVPYDDWGRTAPEGAALLLERSVRDATHVAPEVVDEIADRLRRATRPLLVLGPDLDGRVPMDRLVALAERLDARVHVAPSPHRLPFPNRHRLFGGVLPAGVRSVSRAFAGHDLVLVVGAPVFRYHQHEPGDLLPEGTALVQVTDDVGAATRAPMGEAVLADPAALVSGLVRRLGTGAPTTGAAADRWTACPEPARAEDGLHPAEVFATLRETQPADTAYVVESTSTNADFWAQMDLRHPGSYYFPASGGLGFGLPAAIGVALAQPGRRVVAVVGDGSANYGITALWTAAQLGVPVTFVILRNGSYGALRWFADLLGTPDVPGLDVPGIEFVPLAEGYGVPAVHVKDRDALAHELSRVPDGPRLIQVDTAVTTPEPPREGVTR